MSESLANMVRHVLGDSDKPGLPVVSAVHLLKESHDALLAACKELVMMSELEAWINMKDEDTSVVDCINSAREAIAKAEGGQ